jgi:hypothetical protein
MEFRELRIPDNDEVLATLINARRDLLRVLTESDNFEYANGTRAAAAAPAQSSPPPPSQPAREPETGLRYMLAMRQLDCEIGRLRSPRLIDIAPGADVKPDILKDLLKVDVPDVRKSVDRARDALKTLTAVATIADAAKLLDAQDACEHAIGWIAMVEERCKGEQLHLDVKHEPREVDFVPFRPGNGISIYEFFQRFEDWARGQMSQDYKANVLYNRHLDFSVTDGNKELEDAKGNYPAMKSLLVEKWGNVDTVCDQYLDGIKKVALPSDPKDKAGLLTYVKNAYSKLVTLTKLEIERGQPVPGLADYYLSNHFLKKVHRVLPEEMGSEFLMKLQENGENYHLMKGRVYMDRIISMLRCYYKSLEIMLEEPNSKPDAVNVVAATPDYASSCSSDGQVDTPIRTKRKRKKKPKPPVENQAELKTPVTAVSADSPADSAQHAMGRFEEREYASVGLSHFAPSIGSGPEAAHAEACGPRWACPGKGYDKPPQLTVPVVAANAANSAQSAGQKTKASPACLVQNGSMSANMLNMNGCALQRDDPPTRPVIHPPLQLHQRTEPSQASVLADFEGRIRKLEDELARLRTQSSYQELESCAAKPEASSKTADAACQTEPVPTTAREAPAATTVTKKDAGCNAGSSDSEVENIINEDQTQSSQHIKPRRRRKPRKNRSRGARARAKAAAALALLENSLIEGVSVIPDRRILSIGHTSEAGDASISVVECAALDGLTKDTSVSTIGASQELTTDVGFAVAARDKNQAVLHAWTSPSSCKPQATWVNMGDLFRFVMVMLVWNMLLTPVLA